MINSFYVLRVVLLHCAITTQNFKLRCPFIRRVSFPQNVKILDKIIMKILIDPLLKNIFLQMNGSFKS